MINIDWVYTTNIYNWVHWWDDPDGNRFSYYVMYGNRLLAKVYRLWSDDVDGAILFVNKNDTFKKYTLHWYYQQTAIIWFILWILYNGERESNQPWNVSNLSAQVQVWANA